MRAMNLLLAVAIALPATALAGFEASSFKKPSRSSDASPYDAAAALDGKPETAWMVDPEDENKGQWLELDVPKGKVDKISFIIGWAESDDTWVDHARVKSARVEVISMAGGERKIVLEKDITLEDKKDRQFIDLADPQVGDELEGGKIRITITDVYEGKDFAHLAVGEILVHMAEFDAFTRVVEEASSSAEGHDVSMLIDDSTKTFWAAAGTDKAPSFVGNAGRYSVSSIGLTAGPKSHKRAKTIEVEQGNAVRTYTLKDTTGTQWFDLPALFGYTGSNFGDVTVRIIDTYEGAEPVAFSDVKFRATALEAF